MNWLESLLLGILQGLTEFLPVSSSGHIELGKHFLQVEARESFAFSVVVHGATVLSTLIVFRKDLAILGRDIVQFQWNTGTKYGLKILFSMIPVMVVGFFFRRQVEFFYGGEIRVVGIMFMVTALLLTFASFCRRNEKEIGFRDSFFMGIAQAVAVIPGISRSGATIATGLMLKNGRENVARFSFLMVILPIIGANFLELLATDDTMKGQTEALPLLIGFFSAFVVGLFACHWMVNIVKKGKLIYFGFYCLAIGMITIIFG